MREIRQSGSEGGAMQTNVSSLPLSVWRTYYASIIYNMTLEDVNGFSLCSLLKMCYGLN